MLESLKSKWKRLKRRDSLLFFETPRTGSNSIGTVCRNYGIECHGHNRRGNYKFLYDRDDIEGRFVFCVVRNPIERFVSCYNWLNQGGRNKRDKADAMKFGPFKGINEFIERNLDMKDPNILRQAHFTPMSDYLCDRKGNVIPSLIFKFEELEASQKSVLNLIGSSEIQLPKNHQLSPQMDESSREEIQPRSLALLKKCYFRDFELFYPNYAEAT